MKLKETTQHAIRVIIHLSLHKDSIMTIQQISINTNISAKYLAKILYTLKKKGLVIAIRGCEGGYCLNPEKKYISLYDVIHAIEKDIDIHTGIIKCSDDIKYKIDEINSVYSHIQEIVLENLKKCNLLI